MKFFLLAASLLISGLVEAQQCANTIQGKVLDFHDGSVLIGAVLSVDGEQIYAETDLDGKFILKNVCTGIVKITVTHPECEIATFSVDVTGDLQRDFTLEHHTEELNRVTVTGEKYGNETTTSAEQSLKASTLQKYSGGSLGDALREVSGVSSLNTGSTVVKPIIQGLHSSRVLIINNGTRLADQEWGVEHAPNLDINTAANVTVVKGAGALKYGGDAVGGVIVTEAALAPSLDTLYGNAILGGMSNGRGGSLTSSFTKAYTSGLYIRAQGTLKQFGDREAPDYVLSNTGNKEQDFSLGFGLRKFEYGITGYYSFYRANIGILRASHIGSVSDLERGLNARTPLYIRDFTYDINAPRQDVYHHLARVNAYKRFENAGKLDLSYSFQLNNREEYDIRRGDDKNKPSLDLELTTHTLNTNFEWNSNPGFTANFGLEGNYQVNYPDPATKVRRLIPDYDMYSAAGYAIIERPVNDKLTLEAGARYDYVYVDAQKFYQNTRWTGRNYERDFGNIVVERFENQLLTNPRFTYNNFSGTLGAKYDFTETLKARVNLSSASRAPNPAELFSDGLHHSAAAIELGDLRFNREQSYRAGLSLQGTMDRFTFGLEPYYNRINDFIILEPGDIEQTTRGAFPVFEYRQVDARLFGIDVNAKYQFNEHFDLNGSFAYVNGQDLTRDRPLIDMPAPNWTNTLTYKNEGLNNFQMGLRSQSVFEQTRFPDNDFTLPILQSDGTSQDKTIRLSQPPAGYQLFHFISSIDFNLSEKTKLTVNFDVDNLLDKNYREYLNRQRYFVDDLGRNFKLQLNLNF